MDIIETRRLRLRPMEEPDAPALFLWASSPHVGPDAGWKPHQNEEESLRVIRSLRKQEELWAIESLDTAELLGSISLRGDARRRSVAGAYSMGYALAETAWGNGYMTEAAKALVSYTFEVHGAQLLSADHYPHNQRSRRVIEKCGFSYEGLLRKAAQLYDGQVLDVLCYSITREEYAAGKKHSLPSLISLGGAKTKN
ncbi:GNAT family protein [Oscillospiraceae bacterium MB08-C2-2]|nr:GNAT family protein [Oscillospiraceae bacterium MB08-C2-2]